jgi:hypothetical protein
LDFGGTVREVRITHGKMECGVVMLEIGGICGNMYDLK